MSSNDLLKRAKANIKAHKKKHRDRKKVLMQQRTKKQREEDSKANTARWVHSVM